MRHTTNGLALSLVILTACSSSAASPQAETRITFVGQALIEHDPRAYVDAPLRSLLPMLEAADLVFTNLEVAISGADCTCAPTRTDGFAHGAEPDVLDFLTGIGVSLLALSNNHSWDLGAQGVLSTIAEVESRGITHAGTGAEVSAATAPGYLTLAGGLRVALVSTASVVAPAEARATGERAGVNMLDPGNDQDWERNLAAIQEAARSADLVIAYHHFQTTAESGWQERWAHASIDAGAKIYVSHGDPRLGGVEVYDDALILYGLGNFIFHTRTPVGYYSADVWQSVVVEVTLDGARLREITFTPVVLNEGTEGPLFLETRGYPEIAQGRTGSEILERLVALSAVYGTPIELGPAQAILRIAAPK